MHEALQTVVGMRYGSAVVTWSKNQIDKLGERLRKADTPIAEDRDALVDVLALYDEARLVLENELQELGFHSTSRLKSTETILEKMRRDKTALSRMQDIAGARVVLDGGTHGQDRAVSQIRQRWKGGERFDDRRENPSHGYRAVHAIVRIEGRPCEIQVRTELQHLWAEIYEKLGDILGRQIRYGEPPNDADFVITEDPDGTTWTPQSLVDLMQALSELIARVEAEEEEAAHLILEAAADGQFDFEVEPEEVDYLAVEVIRQRSADIRGELHRLLERMRSVFGNL